ncbi:hypothetical protein, partial [Prevotella denticola]|uniref:hypothetical protein n=1 Tax=Prevotella denticola TaxID=28129 RepID=UPI00241E8A5A
MKPPFWLNISIFWLDISNPGCGLSLSLHKTTDVQQSFKMIKKYVFAAALLSCTAAVRAQNGIIRQSDIEKAKSITRQMTLEEK